jgi:hypothetical protein
MQTLRTTASRADRISASHLATAVLLACAAAGSASAATLSVGPGKTYTAPCAAFNAAKDGDTIEIAGGITYSGDVCSIKRNNLTVRGVNGRPKIDAAGKNAAGKGTWVVDGNNMTVDNVEMYGATVPDANGAALRLEATGFTLRNAFIHDNQNGILSNGVTDSDILIEYSEFGHNGAGDGQTHNLYIGHVKSLTFRYSYSHDANVGHNLKSRASTNMIAYSRFSSTPPGQPNTTASGQPSYEIDLPNAGDSYVIGNIIEQPAANQNPAILAYGEEGATNATQRLYVINNTFLNDYGDGTFLFVSGKVATPAVIQNNIFSGIGTLSTQASSILKTNYRSVAPGFIDRANWDLHPTLSALVINAASDPGVSATGVSLVPVAQYKASASGEARPIVGALDVGAYEATGTAASAAAVTWTQCANENGTCSFSGTREVRFGSNDQYTSKVLTGSTPCSTGVFGDPAHGVVKTCSYANVTTTAVTTTATPAAPAAPATSSTPASADPSWTVCAGEGGTCTFSGTRDVRYGVAGAYATKTFTGSAGCSNLVFGDPAHNQIKTCGYSSTVKADATVTPVSADAGWTTCASEGGTCSFSGTRDVRFGANGHYATKTFTGSVSCATNVFGDPAWRIVKACSFANTTK